MVLYLTGGWYTQIGQRRLRDEVVDGAIDTASNLFRAGVPPHMVSNLALKIRALASYADPPHRRLQVRPAQPAVFTDAERQVMRLRLQTDTDRQPALQCFVADCLEHVHDAMDLRGLYLHLVHITRMMQLLQVARISGAASGLLGGAQEHNLHMAAGHAVKWRPPPLTENKPEAEDNAPSPTAAAVRRPSARRSAPKAASPKGQATQAAPKRPKPASQKPRR